jgi:hypothetical protein
MPVVCQIIQLSRQPSRRTSSPLGVVWRRVSARGVSREEVLAAAHSAKFSQCTKVVVWALIYAHLVILME